MVLFVKETFNLTTVFIIILLLLIVKVVKSWYQSSFYVPELFLSKFFSQSSLVIFQFLDSSHLIFKNVCCKSSFLSIIFIFCHSEIKYARFLLNNARQVNPINY